MIDLFFNKLYPYIKTFKFHILGLTLLSFTLAGIGGLQVSLIKPLFDIGLSPQGGRRETTILAMQLVGLGILNFPCRYYHFYGLRFITDSAMCAIRNDIFNKLLKLPVSFFNQSKQGQLVSSLINDCQLFSQGFKAIIDLIREPLKAMVYIGMAFWADWQLTLIIFIMAPFLIFIFHWSGKKVKNNQSLVQEEYGNLTHNIAESINAQKIIKAFHLKKFINLRFKKTQDSFLKAQMKTTKIEEVAHPFVELVGAFAFAGVIIFAHYRIKIGAITVREFVSFLSALALLMDPLRKFSQANVQINQARAASDRLQSILNLEEERSGGITDPIPFEKKIEIKNLTFSYPNTNKTQIKNINLTIKKGERIAFVGLSGTGKSTLINLLLNLYPLRPGHIFIDGKDIQNISLNSLRSMFALVSQDIFLFHDTIRTNLCLGEEYSYAQINEALSVAYAKEFIENLPLGLETVIGDRGICLSGGQQQRITIARAYLRKTHTLLFDEATSSLDNQSEKIVQKAFENLSGLKTVIAVAHRLSTIQDFDCIYVMNQGSITEMGTHHELIKQNGEYCKLYDLSIKNH